MIDYSKYTIPQLKSELKPLGLPRTGKKSILVARLTKFFEDASFTSFPKLPLELRLKVWEYALPPHRIIELSLGPSPWNSLGTTTPHLTTAMNVMLSNHEALEAVARRYLPNQVQYCFSEQPSDKASQWPIIYKRPNFHDDVFYISQIERTIEALEREHRDHVKRIALTPDDLDECGEQGEITVLLKLSALEEIILVEDLRPPPKQNNRPKSIATQLMEMLSPSTGCLEPPSYLKHYSGKAINDSSQNVAECFTRFVTKHPELKNLGNVTIYFTQIY